MSQPEETLKAHYETKYAADALGQACQIVRDEASPKNRVQACVHFLPRIFKGGDILELGAGDGRLARSLLAASLPCASYTATEFAESRVQALRRHLTGPRVTVSRMDAEHVPSELHGHFDAVIMVALIEHLIDPLGAMHRIRSLLRHGGFVYVDTPNIAKYTRRLKLLAGRFPSTASKREGLLTHEGGPVSLYDEGHLHYFTYGSLSRMLTERCGFSRVQKFGYHVGGRALPGRAGHMFATAWPEMFSEVAVAAYA